MADEREVLRESTARILAADKSLADKLGVLRGLAGAVELRPTLEAVRERVGVLETLGPDSDLALETIVNRVGRPVLEVRADDIVVEGPEAAVWADRLGASGVRAALRRVIPSVGRIEVDGHRGGLTWVGTGWLIADDVVVTNRHVAEEFAARGGAAGSFVFKRGWPDRSTRMAARVDFRRELRNNSPRAFAVEDVLHIEADDGPDFAFLRVDRGAPGGLSPALRPAGGSAPEGAYVATVGYPAADSRIPEQELMTRLFGDKYNVKRLAPGQVQAPRDGLVLHDCSTLGGNSGSPIVDLGTGEVVGLHFSGVFLRENRGVPIGHVTTRLARVLGPNRDTREQAAASPPVVPAAPATPSSPASPPASDGASVTVTVPLTISVSLGGAVTAAPVASVPASVPAPAATVAEAVADATARVGGRADVLAVRDGYVFRNGWITPDPAVVVVLKDRVAVNPADIGLPAEVRGFPVDVRAAGPWDVAAAEGVLGELEGVPETAYEPPADFALTEVHEKMTVTCHVSPDAGWPVLREFLKGTKSGLTVGMYDFTAPHVVAGVLDAVRDDPKTLTLVLQDKASMGGKPDDIPEEVTLANYREALGGRFDHAPASVGKGGRFATAYHIKVAVRDSKVFWLSSGNLQSSNQPAIAPAEVGEATWDPLLRYNREWHVVVENANLAKQFERFIRHDLADAKADAGLESVAAPDPAFVVDAAVEERVPAGPPAYFAPLVVKNRKVRVLPLLTPDNYHGHVLDLINSAERRLLFQNQSLSVLGADATGASKNDPRFDGLVDALLARHRAGVDVRVIIRGEFAPVGPLEQLQRRGFDMGKVRLQNRCHTKGIVVDGARVLVGSHNWTNQGTLVNRDASLIFEDAEVAGYFEDIFWFDWKHLTRQSVGGRRARPSGSDEETAVGERVVTWREIVNGD